MPPGTLQAQTPAHSFRPWPERSRWLEAEQMMLSKGDRLDETGQTIKITAVMIAKG